jgi:hypothetical protein
MASEVAFMACCGIDGNKIGIWEGGILSRLFWKDDYPNATTRITWRYQLRKCCSSVKFQDYVDFIISCPEVQCCVPSVAYSKIEV